MQSNIRSATVRRIVTGLAAMPLAILAGCGVSASTPPTNYTTPNALQGQVFAGRNYMPNATVNVYETQPDGVATNGVYVGKAKLLATTTTNATGGWSLTTVSCSSPDQLYVTAQGGIPYPVNQSFTTLGANPNSLMLTAIGDCSILSTASVSTNVTSIVTNEASTVAALWALRGFISLDGTTVNITSSATNYGGTSGVGTSGNFAGLAHAFVNANLLSPYKIGNFVQYTNGSADGTTGALVPVQELNSLAYAQYLCTIGGPSGNSGDFTYCTQLYQLVTPPGGTAPTNSLQAMLYIANNPSYNATNILTFTLTPIPLASPPQTSSQQINLGVYVPYLTSFGTLTNDWSVAIYYLPNYGVTLTGQGAVTPQYVTIDANDDVFFSNPNNTSGTSGNVIALTSDGRNLWTSDTSSQLDQPSGLAADAAGNVWVANGGIASVADHFVEQINAATGATIKQYPSTSSALAEVAVDSLGNVWYDSAAATGTNQLHELARSGTTYTEANFAASPTSAYGLFQVRPDSKNNIWVGGRSTTAEAALFFPNTGTATAPTYTTALQTSVIPGAVTAVPSGITVDAQGNAYSVTSATGSGVYKTTVTGTGASAVLSSAKVASNIAASPVFMDTDGAGSIWYVDNATGTKLYQYNPSTTTTNTFYPCYNAGTTTGTGSATSVVQTCSTGISARYDLAIDSTGSIWVASYGNTGGGLMAQIIGLAAPTVPLRALGHPGVMP